LGQHICTGTDDRLGDVCGEQPAGESTLYRLTAPADVLVTQSFEPLKDLVSNVQRIRSLKSRIRLTRRPAAVGIASGYAPVSVRPIGRDAQCGAPAASNAE